MAESLLMADSSNKKSEDETCSRKCRNVGDKPITLTDLLESSPEAQQLKKSNFHLDSETNISWSGSFSIASCRKRTSLSSSTLFSTNCPSSSSNCVSACSKLASILENSPSSQILGKRKLKLNEDWGDSCSKSPHEEEDKEIDHVVESIQQELGVLESKLYKIKTSCSTLSGDHCRTPKFFQVTTGKPSIDFYPSPRPPCQQRKQRKKVEAEEMVAEVSSTVHHL